jgi:hypothetical protein
MREGSSETVEVDDSVVLLDRLRGLENLIPESLLDQVLIDSGLAGQKACPLSHRVMLWIVLAMGIFTHLPIRQVFKIARRFRANPKTPPRNSLCDARRRLGVDSVRRVHERVVRPLAGPQTRGAFYHGRRLMALDGSVFDAPDSPANAAYFGRRDGGRGEGAFPLVRKVSRVELGTHVEVALRVGGWHDGESTLARSLWDRIPADALLLADRGFFCVADWKTLNGRDLGLLFRVKSQLALKPVERLADGSYLATIYGHSYDREKDRNGTVVRVIEYTLDDPQRVGHGERHRLLTNRLDARACPALELVCLYHQRWEIELTFDEQKTHHDPRRPGKPAHFRSETPTGVEQEIYALSLGHFVVRAMMAQAAEERDLDVDRLSFVGCLRILQTRLPECDGSSPEGLVRWYRGLLREMGEERIEPRRDRINPRVVKRKMSKFAKKRPHHRRQQPLRKSFAQTVLIE